jgi:hypothetical protein
LQDTGPGMNELFHDLQADQEIEKERLRKRKLCRYCRDGNVPNEKGEHWIVKSIIPAKIDIRKCKAVAS